MEKGTVEATRTLQPGGSEGTRVSGGPLSDDDGAYPASGKYVTAGLHAAEKRSPDCGDRAGRTRLEPKQIREFLDPVSQIDGDSWGVDFGSLVVLPGAESLPVFPSEGAA